MGNKITYIMLLIILMLTAPSQTAHARDHKKIDTSTASDGYVSASEQSSARLKMQVIKGSQTYNYDLNNGGRSERFALQMGNGSYTLRVMKNVGGSRYAKVESKTVNVNLKSQFAPFLVSNQYVSYSNSSNAVSTAKKLVSGQKTRIAKVEKIYNYVTKNIKYDVSKASNVRSGYVSNVDATLRSKKGICLDYAALMAAMLRSQGIPTKMVTGYVSPNNAYHAWVEVYLTDKGWVNVNQIYFGGNTWKLMDPTFASSSNQSKQIVKFIGNGSNYKVRYIY